MKTTATGLIRQTRYTVILSHQNHLVSGRGKVRLQSTAYSFTHKQRYHLARSP